MIKKGFTLAELLLVIVIVGVVATLAVSNLSKVSETNKLVSSAKKTYNELHDAFKMAELKYGKYYGWTVTDLKNRMMENLSVEKDCGTAVGCFSSGYYIKTDSTRGSGFDASITGQKILLNSNVSVAFKSATSILIDIDGPNKGNNESGVDIFNISIINKEMYPGVTAIAGDGSSNIVGGNELAWIIYYGNMDYRYCLASLAWFGKTNTTCK